jgi:MOSC domain-containing protein YiiM
MESANNRPPRPRVLSVNVGRPRTIPRGKRPVTTAIWKSPVDGRVAARDDHLEGDQQADRRVHGGYDKAVYAYAREDYEWWERELGRELGPGSFGENLTTQGLDLNAARAGERWRIGTVLLEVSEPRLPCQKLGLRMEDYRFPKRFAAALRPGAYLRIVEAGELGAGDEIEVVERPDHEVTMRFMADSRLSRGGHDERLLAAADAIPAKWRRRALRPPRASARSR